VRFALHSVQSPEDDDDDDRARRPPYYSPHTDMRHASVLHKSLIKLRRAPTMYSIRPCVRTHVAKQQIVTNRDLDEPHLWVQFPFHRPLFS